VRENPLSSEGFFYYIVSDITLSKIMFEPLENMLKRIKKAKANDLSLSVFVLPEIKQFIIRLNRVEQLYKEGLDVNDKVIGTYAWTTAMSKGEQTYTFEGIASVKKYGEPYTLFDTGSFFESFNVVFKKDGFVITADTEKPGKDLMEYGEILGLTAESKDELSKKMLPFLQESLREYLLS
jgi:hypothetical protein